MKFFIHTTGCKANQWDAHVISNRLRQKGLTPSAIGSADVIIINACTLTDGAERDVRRFINTGRRKNGKAKIILAGCHAQVYPERSYGADLVLGQEDKFHIDEYLQKKGSFVTGLQSLGNGLLIENSPLIGEGPAGELPAGKTRFFFKIQDGCDRFCSYCIVPYARGKPRSRPADDVLRTMELLKERGIKEVVLTGIEISAYRDPGTGADLKGLLRRLEESETPNRIRMSSIDPLYIDDELVDIIAGSGKLARSLHIPMQSASDEVLAGMGRHYTQAYIGKLLKGLHEKIDDVGIGVDVIAGFPGEDEERFTETYRFIESAGIYYLHVFPFSPRSGTLAAGLRDQVPDALKKRRVRLLRRLDAIKRRTFYERFFGKRVEIIPEGKLYRGRYMRGYTDNYLPVHIPFTKRLENNCVAVTIKGMEEGILMGGITGEDSMSCKGTGTEDPGAAYREERLCST
ncbi:MAG: Threonylcarbamoyladenosine tRNA methylthiotransferase MtaB [Syntrophorhabdus sp. PtaU1.Bin058]|nr:MAG: Threonylcarbamoyladenosine tRNA methylthiotransferase MtaB [Syntrophorhabdus sp. PtaU1.Bin058]